MIDMRLQEFGATPSRADRPAVPRRRLLTLIGWGLLPVAAAGLASCQAPTYDPSRGLFVLRPKK